MTAEQFAYWLQGFAELNTEPPTKEQWQSINEHLKTVFTKVTPSFNPVRMFEPHPDICRKPDITRVETPLDNGAIC